MVERYSTQLPGDGGEPTSVPQETGRLGPYQLLSELGRGAMGIVYEAEHTQLGRRVALKVLPEELADSPECYARFQREMQAIGRLEHPNIVLATDAGQVDGVCFIAMQLIRGVDLSRVLNDKGSLTVGQACEVARQVALGLQEIESHGVIHRDIKPSNLLLAGNGEVKILDLGIASLRQGSSFGDKLTMTGGFLGTPDYVAPEQIHNQGPLDIRADIYSLGCTLYHLLCGHAPFTGPQYNSLPAKLMGHAEHAPEPLDAVLEVPPKLLDVMSSMMAKNRDERIQRPIDLVAALAPFCDTESLDKVARAYGESNQVRGRCVVAEPEDARIIPHKGAAGKRTGRKSRRGRERGKRPAIAMAFLALGMLSYACWSLLNSGRENQGVVSKKQQPSTGTAQPITPNPEPVEAVPDDAVPDDAEEQPSETPNVVAENTPIVAAEPNVLNVAAAEVADSTLAVAKNTERIAVSLEQMQEQFSEVIDEVHADPQTPTEWYANALVHASSGNQLGARKAYLKFFEFELNVIDPWMNFATLLRVQEGVAGARETLSAIPGDATLPARRLVEISLQPIENRRDQLQELRQKNPDFGPMHLALAESYEGEVTYDTRLTLLDQMAKKTAIEDYLAAHADGRVLKYYLDQSVAKKQLDKATALQKNFAEVTQQVVDNPVDFEWFYALGDNEFVLDFAFPESARSPEYRFGKDGDFTLFESSKIDIPQAFRSRYPIGQDGLRMEDFDGTLVSVTRLKVPDSTPKSTLQIRYKDRNGAPRGPYELAFSPEEMMQQQALKGLHRKDLRDDWVELRHGTGFEPRDFPEFDKRYDKTDVSFRGFLLHGWRAVKSIQYGLDVETPNRDFPVPAAGYSSETRSEYGFETKGHVRYAVLQVTFTDGTKTEVLRFDADDD